METLILLATVASGIGATRRPAFWLFPVVVGVASAIRLGTRGSFDDSGDEVTFAVVIVASYLGAAAFGWLAASAAQRFVVDRRTAGPE